MPEKQPETAQTVEYLQGEKGVVRLMPRRTSSSR
jgi:hypothetical protein